MRVTFITLKVVTLALLVGDADSTGTLVEILGSGEGKADNCADEGTIAKLAHAGWPYSIDCSDIADKLRDRNYTLYKEYRDTMAECTLRHTNGSTFWNVISSLESMYLSSAEYPIFDIENSLDLLFHMELQIPDAGLCSKLDIQIRVDRVPDNLTCENLHEVMEVIDKKLDEGNAYKMTCLVDYNEEPRLFLDNSADEDVEYEWWYNCSRALPENTIPQGSSLTIHGSDFTNGGIYSCAVKYRGQRRFLTRHEICVKYPNAGTTALKCPVISEAKEGEDLNVTCNLDLGLGRFPFLFLDMTWYKILNGTREKICRAFPFNGLVNSSYADNIQCLNSEFRVAQKCFQYLPPVEERQPEKHSFQFSLLIRDLKVSDEGEYLLIFTVSFDDRKNSTIRISINHDDDLTSNASIVAIVVSVLLTFIVLAILCVWRKTDLLWFFKKHFGAYDKDDKTYTAYLSYHFSRDTMNDFSRNMMEKFIDNLCGFMNGLGAKTYDDHRDANEVQMQIENIALRQKDCHRIIIILNKEYVTDHWNLHKAYLALRNMIEGGSQVIFIVLPGVEESYNEIPDEPRTALKYAMKMNTTIKWSGKLPLGGSFRRRLEYALPKIRKEAPRTETNPPEKIMMQAVV